MRRTHHNESCDDEASETHTALVRYDGQGGVLRALQRRTEPTWGIHARNREQTFAMELLLDDSIQLVTMVGKAGTGKTLLALAAGLSKVTEEQVYQRVLVSRPIFPLVETAISSVEKIGPLDETFTTTWNSYSVCSLVVIRIEGDRMGQRRSFGVSKSSRLPIFAVARSSSHFIVDEAQNLTPHEVKTI